MGKLKISQTESSITSSVSSQIKIVNDKIDSKDSSLRSYVQNNYSTKTQTANLIESKVSSVSNSVSSLGSRISNAESKISQTANEISSKVSKDGIISAINQSAESIKIKASKINLDGNVNLTGTFTTYDNYGKTVLENGELRFYKGSSLVGSIYVNSNGMIVHASNFSFSTGNTFIDFDDYGIVIRAVGSGQSVRIYDAVLYSPEILNPR